MITELIRAMEEQCSYDPIDQLTVGHPYPDAISLTMLQAREVEEQIIFESMDRSSINSSIVTQCQFINNMASFSGGAIYKNGINRNLVIYQNSYIDNIVNAFGGTIYINGTNSSANVTGAIFINNTAITEGGGAIYSNGQ